MGSSQRSPVRSSVGSPVDMRKQLALCLTLIFLSIGLVACESTEEEVWEGEDAPPFCPSTWFDSGEKMDFLQADRYCKEAYNSSALAEALTEEQFSYIREVAKILEAQTGQRTWWMGATDLGVETDRTWLRSHQPVGDYVWFRLGYGTGTNCMTLNFAAGYAALAQDCTRVSSYPICQLK